MTLFLTPIAPVRWRRVATVLSVSVVIALITAWIADRWPRGELLIDELPYRFTEAIQVEWINDTLRFVGHLGGVEILVPLGLSFACMLSIKAASFRPLAMASLAWGVSVGLVAAGKQLLDRPEPRDNIGDLGLSFPSGHVAQAMAMYLALALITQLIIPQWSRVAKVLAYSACSIVFIATQYRSTHWLTDSIGAGAVALIGITIAYLDDQIVARLEQFLFVRKRQA